MPTTAPGPPAPRQSGWTSSKAGGRQAGRLRRRAPPSRDLSLRRGGLSLRCARPQFAWHAAAFAPPDRRACACGPPAPDPARPPSPRLSAELSPGGNKTFFDIGCNKGYTSAHYFGLWAPELGFNPAAMVAKHPNLDCGFCEDCRDKVGGERAELAARGL